jgi:hypothetical protein
LGAEIQQLQGIKILHKLYHTFRFVKFNIIRLDALFQKAGFIREEFQKLFLINKIMPIIPKFKCSLDLSDYLTVIQHIYRGFPTLLSIFRYEETDQKHTSLPLLSGDRHFRAGRLQALHPDNYAR